MSPTLFVVVDLWLKLISTDGVLDITCSELNDFELLVVSRIYWCLQS